MTRDGHDAVHNSLTLVTCQGEAGRAALREAVGTGEYFLAILPDGTRLVQTISGAMRHPIPFGREAAAELAGVPHRADWKTCQASIKPVLQIYPTRLAPLTIKPQPQTILAESVSKGW